MTNTMMVVIVVSRRVGQVTLAVSARTSCRNLNGLNAIVDIRVPRKTNQVLNFKQTEQPSCALSSSQRRSRQPGSIVRGIFKAAPDVRFEAGRQQVPVIYCRCPQRSRHERVRKGFRALTATEPDRYLLIDASRPQAEISREIQDRIREILPDPVPAGTEDVTSTFPAITDA